MSKPVAKLDGTFTGVAAGGSIRVNGKFNVLIDGGDATVVIERSFDDGAIFYPVSLDSTGAPASYATATNGFNGLLEEPEDGMLWRLNCTVYVSGTVTWRLSQ